MNNWNGTDQALPSEREYVQFILAGHRSWLYGVYAKRSFRSRWATYLAREVSAWRKLGDAPLVPAPVRTAPDQRYWSERPMRES